MTLSEFRAFMDNNSYLIDISITGGETYLRPDIVDFWLELDRRGFYTNVTTNAVAIEEAVEKESFLLRHLSGKYRRHIGISIDGLGQTHDHARGVKQGFEKASRFLEWALQAEKEFPFVCVDVIFTLSEQNYRELPLFIDYMAGLGVSPAQISFPVAISSSHYYHNDGSLRPIGNQGEFIGMLKAVKERYPEYRNDAYRQGLIHWLENPAENRLPCFAGASFCHIDPYWNVYPCIALDEKLGNLRDCQFRLDRLWNSEALLNFRRRMRRDGCNLCWNTCDRWFSMRSSTINLLRLAWNESRKEMAGRDEW